MGKKTRSLFFKHFFKPGCKPNNLPVKLCFFIFLFFAINYNLYSQVTPGSIAEETIDSYLATPASGSVKTIPVVILRYLPTTDGINLDVSKATDYWDLGYITLEQLKANIDMYLAGLKFSLEEGSKFHGYKDPEAVPYLGYKVVKFWTIYNQIPISTAYQLGEVEGHGIFEPDFIRVYDDFDLKQYIEDYGVKEIWIWFGQCAMPGWPSYNPAIHLPENYVEFVESNMSSPTTGDISNSYRSPDDIPISNKTAVVYCYNFRRTQAEAVHNHGHQLESVYKYTAEQQDGNSDLFVHDFSGWGSDYSSPPLGRAGDCHHPPNTTNDYDYLNSALVESDIEDWSPAGGTKKMVNADTWADLDYSWPAGYDFPQRTESQWYIYWMQNMPGYNNAITYNSNHMTNWWQFTSDWDLCAAQHTGLYAAGPLPVELSSFTASFVHDGAELKWTTATEVNNSGFDIERKPIDNGEWSKIGFVAGAGNSNSVRSYSFIDKGVKSGNYSYRLKQIDNNGACKYSNTAETHGSASLPAEFELSQNYPNPFNPSTIIRYELPEACHVILKVTDMLGKEVAVLVNEIQGAGVHDLELATKNYQMSSGVYLYRMTAGNFSAVKKLVIMK